jgi:bifunctional DNA-binding transcriptional regulator/antitoxin component of YhaV-PrlF toxin-antitoxin module
MRYKDSAMSQTKKQIIRTMRAETSSPSKTEVKKNVNKKSYFVSVQTRGVLALPISIRKKHKLDEPGAQVELIERPDGVIELHPHVPVPADQAWFWTPAWQEGEREASEQIAHGDVTVHDADDFLDALDALVED